MQLFQTGEPNPQHEADVVAKVHTLDKRGSNGGATVTQTARVLQIFKSSDARIKEGDIVALRYPNSSCLVGPNDRDAVVYAKTRVDSKGAVIWHLYTPAPPLMLPEGFSNRLRPIQTGDKIPQDFAVVLVGLSGKTHVSSISFDHSKNFRMELSMHADFSQRTNTIVAFAIPVGVKQLNVYNYTDREKVNTRKIDIERPGLYYMATLNTDMPGEFQEAPRPEQLKEFRAGYAGMIEHLKTVNFTWPTQ